MISAPPPASEPPEKNPPPTATQPAGQRACAPANACFAGASLRFITTLVLPIPPWYRSSPGAPPASCESATSSAAIETTSAAPPSSHPGDHDQADDSILPSLLERLPRGFACEETTFPRSDGCDLVVAPSGRRSALALLYELVAGEAPWGDRLIGQARVAEEGRQVLQRPLIQHAV